jgi:hypothetical protein
LADELSAIARLAAAIQLAGSLIEAAPKVWSRARTWTALQNAKWPAFQDI